ncbi:hypothetical protein [Moorena sp. SIOASIH]|nr:hypothetical protein [Moorena sp. SIOASIH]
MPITTNTGRVGEDCGATRDGEGLLAITESVPGENYPSDWFKE